MLLAPMSAGVLEFSRILLSSFDALDVINGSGLFFSGLFSDYALERFGVQSLGISVQGSGM